MKWFARRIPAIRLGRATSKLLKLDTCRSAVNPVEWLLLHSGNANFRRRAGVRGDVLTESEYATIPVLSLTCGIENMHER